MVYLPNDVLYMVCTQLWHQGDFNTLFSCACSGKRLAPIAITYLYRIQAVSPVTPGHRDEDAGDDTESESDEDAVNDTESESDEVTNDGSDEDSDKQTPEPQDWIDELIQAESLQRQLAFIKCTSLWRTIILSSLGKTLYPYSQYIRTLNLQDLEELINQSEVRARIGDDLTHSEILDGFLGIFQDEPKPLCKLKKKTAIEYSHRLDSADNTNRIGEAITKKTPLLEELRGNIFSRTLSRWIPRLPRLTHLEILHSAAIKDNGTLIRLHCPSFKQLHIRNSIYNDSKSTQHLAAFLNEIRPQSLESFKTFDYQTPGPEIFQALSCHGESLVELKLNLFPILPIAQVSLLKGCTNLVSLSLTGNAPPYLASVKQSDIDALVETVAWLKECKRLRILAFTKSFNLPMIIPIFLKNITHLTSLEYEVFGYRDIAKLHQALANQTSLQRLWLKGRHNYVGVDDGLVESLSKLVNLTDMRLEALSTNLLDRHIMQLARSLPKLEFWSTEGRSLTDAIWGEVATLRSLRRLDLRAFTRFTAEGIVGFIEKLGPGNKGLVLSVMNAERSSDLSATEQELIHETITKKAQGRFEFHLTNVGHRSTLSQCH